MAPKSVGRFKQRIRELTRRSQGISMDQRLGRSRSYLRGWMDGWMDGFGLANQLRLFAQLDGWIRRRIRMCYQKQWRRPKRCRQMLIQLGFPIRQAIRCARFRKGYYWHMSKTIASGDGLTDAWLAEQGLLRIKNLWATLAPLRRTA